MPATEITCELVDQRDLDTRYLAGALNPDEAETFEAHYFGCERCWGLVQQGLAVRSAFDEDAAPTASSSGAPPRGWANRRWWGLAAAAGIAVVAVGVWRLGQVSEAPRPEEVFRGEGAPLVVATAANGTALTAAWPRVADAGVYRVRLYGADGMMAVERETSDTSVSVPVDSLAGLATGTELFWQVQALDHLGNSVARSDLIRAVPPNP
jgi:hypothetical protein